MNTEVARIETDLPIPVLLRGSIYHICNCFTGYPNTPLTHYIIEKYISTTILNEYPTLYVQVNVTDGTPGNTDLLVQITPLLNSSPPAPTHSLLTGINNSKLYV